MIKTCLLLAAMCCSGMNLHAQDYITLHNKAIVVDTHNDIISKTVEKGYKFDSDLTGKTHSDLQRMMQSLDVQVFSVWCDGTQQNPFAFANREIDSLDAWVARNTDKMMKVTTPAQLMQAVKDKKLAAMIGVEGGHMIENDMSKLDSLFARGTRYMTLTWNNSTTWATSAKEETHDSLLHQPKGLSDFGKQIVKHMNELGMMVDLSHVGERTFWDAIQTTTKPVIVSHSDAYALCPVPRNLKDDQIKAVAKNGGVIDVNFYSGFIDSNFEKRNDAFIAAHKAEKDSLMKTGMQEFFADDYIFEKYKTDVQALRPPLSMLLNHIDYIVKLAGVDHVGLGSDFDGINSAPRELNQVTDLPLVTKGLMERGYSNKDIEKILGGNFIRVFKANMK